MKRAVVIIMLLAAGIPAIAEAQTVILRGRLVHVDGLRTANVRLSFGADGSTVTDANGVFEKSISAGVSEVPVAVEESAWTILYPPNGRVVVPRDENVMVEIFAGEPVERRISRALAEQHERMISELTAAGAQQEAIREMLEAFFKDVTEKLNVDEQQLREAIALEQKRQEDFPDFAEMFRYYTLRARDLHDAFKLLKELSIQHGHVRDTLNAAILRYNDAYIDLNNNRGRIETAVFNFWEDPQLAAEVRSLYDNDITELHNLGFLSLNESLVVLHELGAQRRPNRDRVREAIARIDQTLAYIAPRLEQFERKTERFLEALFRN